MGTIDISSSIDSFVFKVSAVIEELKEEHHREARLIDHQIKIGIIKD